MGTRFLVVGVITTFLAFAGTVRAQDIDAVAVAGAVRAEVATNVGTEVAAALAEIADAEPSAEGAEGLGHALLMNRHLEMATYLFAAAVERDPSRAAALSNLGVTALELSALGQPLAALGGEGIVDLQRLAVGLAPDDNAIRLNLATALLRLGGDEAVAEAADILREISEADPEDSLAAVRLAEALAMLGEMEEATTALGRAFAARPMSPAVSFANAAIFDGGGITPPANSCNVDFRCDEVCPGGIIGRLNYVTCEISNTTAQSDCEAGRPFAESFDCRAQMPRFGILIPGLDPGFSILTPWGSIDLIQQGDGSIDYRVRFLSPSLGPAQAFVDSKGSYQPSNGELQWTVEPGFQYSLFNNNPAGEVVNRYDVGTSAVVRYNEARGRVELRLDTARGVVISN